MVVQVTFLAEGLRAERAEDLQSQVLGSVVAVKVPPAEKTLLADLTKLKLLWWKILGMGAVNEGGNQGNDFCAYFANIC